MLEISDLQFEEFVNAAWEKVPPKFRDQLENVDIKIEPFAAAEQVENVHADGELLGLFEGMPKAAWGQATLGTQPSKISIFQLPILKNCRTIEQLPEIVLEVLMHEIGHYFGYNDDAMYLLDAKLRKKFFGE